MNDLYEIGIAVVAAMFIGWVAAADDANEPRPVQKEIRDADGARQGGSPKAKPAPAN